MIVWIAAAAAWAGSLAGTWVSDQGESITLNADGTALYGGAPLRWSSVAATLTLQGGLGAVQFGYRLAGADLVLSANGQEVTFHGVALGNADPAMVGRWQARTATWVLNADGTGRVGKDAFQWSAEPGAIVILANGQAGRVPYRRDGNTVIATVQGREETLVLLEGAAGTWVGTEGSVDPTIAMSYTQYITLFPDHSVGWSKSELTASRTEPAPGWEKFSSGHESGGAAGSYGTWTDQGGQLTIQFSSGKTMYGVVAPDGESVVLHGAGVLEQGADVRFTRQ